MSFSPLPPTLRLSTARLTLRWLAEDADFQPKLAIDTFIYENRLPLSADI